ncbi:hypothetical protein TNCV_4177711 [Trichonephila clavipes]|nr:hypothetical protein TNCV_4177711 [Trichonephila clavipes]
MNSHSSILTKLYVFNQLLHDQCMWPWGHCLLFELGQDRRHLDWPTYWWKENRRPLTIDEAFIKRIMSSRLVSREWDNRNRWSDGPVCPEVGQGIMASWSRRPGSVFECY